MTMLTVKNDKGEYWCAGAYDCHRDTSSWTKDINKAKVFKGKSPVGIVLRHMKEGRISYKVFVVNLSFKETGVTPVDMSKVKYPTEV